MMYSPKDFLGNSMIKEMSIAETTSILFLLNYIKTPKCVLVGVESEDVIRLFSENSDKVFTFNLNNKSSFYDLGNIKHEVFHFIESVNGTNKEVDVVFLEGKNYEVKQSIENILEINPTKTVYILIHNSFNPFVRKGILDIAWQKYCYVHNVELDYVKGNYLNKELYGGIALIVLNAEKRSEEIVVNQEDALYSSILKSSIHIEPFNPSKILLNITKDSLLEIVKRKKIVFFGTGSASIKILDSFPFEVSYFVDNNTNKHGLILNGLEIKGPEALLNEDKENIAIIIASQYGNEISIQLAKMGFEENVNFWNGYSIFSMNRPMFQKYFLDQYLKEPDYKCLKVSVIVPNYNYSIYLKERLYSIINQTVTPHEIIFLDDVSTDNSAIIAESILAQSNIPYKIIKNKENSGCFKQWLKGISFAQGDIIWIAEADDACRLDFLEEALAPFEDLEVNLSYVQSRMIDNSSKIFGFDYIQYTDDLSRTKWLTDYCQYGRDEIVQGLAIKNTIPNASAVLMRKSALEGLEYELKNYSICGDWFTYVYVLKQGKIAFNAKTLNYHRRHEASIISSRANSIEYFKELWQIKKFISCNYLLPLNVQSTFFEYIEEEYARLEGNQLNFIGENPLEPLKDQVKQCLQDQNEKYGFLKQRKKILFVILNLEVGGAEIFEIRLANYLATFNDVYLYNARPFQVDLQVQKMISPNVYQLYSNGDPKELAAYIKKYNIQSVNSHAWWADKLAYKALCDMPNVKFVISMHGLYEFLEQNPEVDEEFNQLYPLIMNRVNSIVYAADKNIEVIKQRSPEILLKVNKIYNGFPIQSIQPLEREYITKDRNSFIFGLVSRAIPEKGWEESIQAIITINADLNYTHHLVIIGKSSYSDSLKEKYGDYDFLHFVDALTKPYEWLSWVQAFDVGILPTYFVSESMPIAVIEYLSYGKPVISTDIGEIKHMLNHSSGKTAGILLKLNDDQVSVDDLVKAMKTMILDKQKYNDYKNNTKLMISEFSMSKCADAYYALF